MATQTIRLNLGRLSGTFTADVYLDNSNTTFATAAAMSAEAQPGFYTFTVTSSSGLYSIIVKESGSRIGSWYVRTTDTAATFAAGDTRDEVSAASERATLQASVNDVPTNAELTTALATIPKAGETRRYTQVAANSGSKTADVSIGNPL
jgi:hypothetical protein